jgi:hypothetical protein
VLFVQFFSYFFYARDMNFAINFKVDVDDALVGSSTVIENIADYRESLGELAYWQGNLVVSFGGEDNELDFSEPLVRLAGGWLRKIPWLIGGDTETLALRNSAQCFAFVPTGSAIEVSFFDGDESEIEDYVVQPNTAPIDQFVEASLGFGRQVIAMIDAFDSSLMGSDDDCLDLAKSVGEATSSWRESQLKQRR